MDRSRFAETSPGQLVEITSPSRDVAFVPEPLPPKWKFPQGLWPLVVCANTAVARLDGMAQQLPHPQFLLRPLLEREAIRSSQLEGTFATPEELALFEATRPKQSKDRDSRDASIEEVMNYSTALSEGWSLLEKSSGDAMGSGLIRAVHQWLMQGVRGSDKEPGNFRTTQVFVDADRRYVPPPPEFVQQCMGQLSDSIKGVRDFGYDPLVSCYMAHYQLEAIHPFLDGNGRVGRVLLALMIYSALNMRMPWLYMSPYFERNKGDYIALMFDVSATGTWERWIEFCLKGTIEQAEDATKRCEQLVDLRSTMHRAVESAGSSRLHAIVDMVFDLGFVTVPAIRKQLEVSSQTARRDIAILEGKDIVSPLSGQYRGMKVFYSPAMFSIVHSDDPSA